jgi:sugar phosphate isomerase/epimerase
MAGDVTWDTQLGMCPATLLPDLSAPTEGDILLAVDACAAAGFTELSLWELHLRWVGDLSARGLRVRVLEGAHAWANGTQAETKAEAARFAAKAADLRAPLVLAFVLDATLVDPSITQRNLATLVAAVEEAGATVCVEFLPFSGVPDLATAWRLVEPLGPAAALAIDTWHWKRQPGGPDPHVLGSIPGGRIAYVQLCDAAPEAAEELRTEAMLGRRLPGDGVVDFNQFFAALSAADARPFFAPEVFNPDLVRDLGPLGAAKAARSAAEQVLEGSLPRST